MTEIAARPRSVARYFARLANMSRIGKKLIEVPNGTSLNFQVPRISVIFPSNHSAIDLLGDSHKTLMQGLVAGVYINTGLLFWSMHLRGEKSGNEMLLVCFFDGRRFWSLTHPFPHRCIVPIQHWKVWYRSPFKEEQLSRLLNGEYLTQYRESMAFRIKRHEEYFNWRRCYRSIFCCGIILTVSLITFLMIMVI